MQLSYLPNDDIVKEFIQYQNRQGKLYKKGDRTKYERDIQLGLNYFRGVTELTAEMLTGFEVHLINQGMAKNTAINTRSHVNVFYKWLNKEKNVNSVVEISEGEKKEMQEKSKKVNFNIDAVKYKKLSAYALKYDMTLTELYTEMTDDFIERHKDIIDNITGIF